MRLYRLDDRGEPVLDIQSRLRALEFLTTEAAVGEFDDATRNAVTDFQSAKGLPSDGIVGPETWSALVAASYRLGDRLLYYKVPLIRGDDVAELQRRLNSLGFDANKVDGFFGPETLGAVLEFQQNRGLAEDGIVGPVVASELDLMRWVSTKPGRENVRERQWLWDLPRSLAGQRVLLDAGCRTDEEDIAAWATVTAAARVFQNMGAHPTLSRTADTRPDEQVRARRSNRLGIDFVLSFSLPINDVPGVFYFASQHSTSAAGKALATAIANRLGMAVQGRSTSILMETREPAVAICADLPIDVDTIADSLVELFAANREDRMAMGIQ